MTRYSLALMLAIGLSAPIAGQADDHDRRRDHTQEKRYYDRTHHDYHRWDDNESRSYNVFLGERHVQAHAWTRAKHKEQQEYWKWRHEHPDGRR